jgi:PAS domain S-box-containing protein
MEAVLDSASDGIMIENAERVVYANNSYATLLGYRRPVDLVTHPVVEFIAGSDVDRLMRYGRNRAAGQRVPSTYDFAGRRKDGSPVRLQASVSLTTLGAISYIMTIVRPLAEVAATPDDEPLPGPHDSLSARERQVMELLLAGKRPKVIAAELGVNENTIATHRARMLEKVGVADNRELFQYALKHRLVDWS